MTDGTGTNKQLREDLQDDDVIAYCLEGLRDSDMWGACVTAMPTTGFDSKPDDLWCDFSRAAAHLQERLLVKSATDCPRCTRYLANALKELRAAGLYPRIRRRRAVRRGQ